MDQSQFSDILTPTLLLDEGRCRKHIQRMADKAQRLGLTLRPHFKTPQSAAIGAWFRDYGIEKITVSSLTMATYFANQGWNDITVAFPVNIRELSTIQDLAARIQLGLVVENLDSIQYLESHLTHPVSAWIKINIGNNRTGILPSDETQLEALLQALHKATQLKLEGFLGHAGQSYQARGQEAIAQVHRESLYKMYQLIQRYQSHFPNLKVSVGDTPTCSVMDTFPGANELRPGNFLFYDLMQWQIGSCQIDDIALVMACPVVAKNKISCEITLYGGAIHFSKDHLLFPDGKPYYGLAVRRIEDQWKLVEPYAYIKTLSQEHGIVKANPAYWEELKIGDLAYIIPVHACLTANLLKSYRTMGGEYLSMMH
ncbi:MAG TPA: alanine racemase [Saprospiraceae bacterium]|nr:alanine racemase [Saprospiraceae bacterium]HMQ83494.1 alanine racemase [Saprospiraceae bacterium]